jgi:hypothetical protein
MFIQNFSIFYSDSLRQMWQFFQENVTIFLKKILNFQIWKKVLNRASQKASFTKIWAISCFTNTNFIQRPNSNIAWQTKFFFALNLFFRYKKFENVEIKKKLQMKPILSIFHKWKVNISKIPKTVSVSLFEIEEWLRRFVAKPRKNSNCLRISFEMHFRF